jgi:short-subunit dehydrogenase
MSTDTKIAWITGASTGIGAATAKKLASEGWQVMATARSKDKLESMAAESAGKIHACPCDVTDPQAVSETVKQIEEGHGSIDLAILNAGTYVPETAQSFTAENFDAHMKLNVSGVAYCLEAVLPGMLQRDAGHIAFVASVAGYRGLPRAMSYSPSKAAVIKLAESLAIECIGTGIKVQVVNPGFIKTPLTDKNDFYMPMLMDVDVAAGKLAKGLKARRFEIIFPWAFAMFLKVIGLLPDRLYFRLVANTREPGGGNA